MTEEPDFHGAKVAIFINEEILVYRRDNKPDIPFPNMLDLPGGGRENGETGAECVARETFEEFGINIPADRFVYVETYPNWRGKGEAALFFVCTLASEILEQIVFGDEGQGWQMMQIGDYLNRKDAVPHLQMRVSSYV